MNSPLTHTLLINVVELPGVFLVCLFVFWYDLRFILYVCLITLLYPNIVCFPYFIKTKSILYPQLQSHLHLVLYLLCSNCSSLIFSILLLHFVFFIFIHFWIT